jgi:hypothetical protein
LLHCALQSLLSQAIEKQCPAFGADGACKSTSDCDAGELCVDGECGAACSASDAGACRCDQQCRGGACLGVPSFKDEPRLTALGMKRSIDMLCSRIPGSGKMCFPAIFALEAADQSACTVVDEINCCIEIIIDHSTNCIYNPASVRTMQGGRHTCVADKTAVCPGYNSTTPGSCCTCDRRCLVCC